MISVLLNPLKRGPYSFLIPKNHENERGFIVRRRKLVYQYCQGQFSKSKQWVFQTSIFEAVADRVHFHTL